MKVNFKEAAINMRFALSLLLIILFGTAVHGQDVLETAQFYKSHGFKQIDISRVVGFVLPNMISLCNEAEPESVRWAEFETGHSSLTKVSVVRYPILGDNPFPLLYGGDLKLSIEAFEMARNLARECGCDRALKDYGIPSLSKLLMIDFNVNTFNGRSSTLGLPFYNKKRERLTVGFKFNESRNRIGAQVIGETFTGRGKVIFLNDYFFNPRTNAGTATYQRALILIHESVHQFGNKSDSDFGGSRILNDLLIKKCLPSLDSMLGDLDM
jgi:hypothetical protein